MVLCGVRPSQYRGLAVARGERELLDLLVQFARASESCANASARCGLPRALVVDSCVFGVVADQPSCVPVGAKRLSDSGQISESCPE